MRATIQKTTFKSLDRKKFRGKVKAIFFSPPYNNIPGPKKSTGDRKNGLYDNRSYSSPEVDEDYPDFMPEAEYEKDMISSIGVFSRLITDDGVIIMNHKNRMRKGYCLSPYRWLERTLKRYSLEYYHEYVWNRGSSLNNGMHNPTNISEKVIVLRKTGAAKPYYKKQFIKQDGKFIAIPDVFKMLPDNRNSHPAPFPIILPYVFLSMYSKKGDLVCDPYSGSGTTAMAACDLGRNFIGTEISSKFFDQSRERLECALGSSEIATFPADDEFSIYLKAISERDHINHFVDSHGDNFCVDWDKIPRKAKRKATSK